VTPAQLAVTDYPLSMNSCLVPLRELSYLPIRGRLGWWSSRGKLTATTTTISARQSHQRWVPSQAIWPHCLELHTDIERYLHRSTGRNTCCFLLANLPSRTIHRIVLPNFHLRLLATHTVSVWHLGYLSLRSLSSLSPRRLYVLN